MVSCFSMASCSSVRPAELRSLMLAPAARKAAAVSCRPPHKAKPSTVWPSESFRLKLGTTRMLSGLCCTSTATRPVFHLVSFQSCRFFSQVNFISVRLSVCQFSVWSAFSLVSFQSVSFQSGQLPVLSVFSQASLLTVHCKAECPCSATAIMLIFSLVSFQHGHFQSEQFSFLLAIYQANFQSGHLSVRSFFNLVSI